jgi:hypothetical protein
MFSGIVRVDAKATRHSDGLDVWHMEVAGLSDNASNDHIIDDAKMSLRMDLLNLIAILKNHLDCDVNVATKIKVFCTQAVRSTLCILACILVILLLMHSNYRNQIDSICPKHAS